jgi:sensor domain CHASE-containing protein
VALKQQQEQEQVVKAALAVKVSHPAFLAQAAAVVLLLLAQRVKILVQARAVRALQTH